MRAVLVVAFVLSVFPSTGLAYNVQGAVVGLRSANVRQVVSIGEGAERLTVVIKSVLWRQSEVVIDATPLVRRHALASKGHSFVVVNFTASSKVADPNLPQILLLSVDPSSGLLLVLGKLDTRYPSWLTESSYLGYDYDRRNDFAIANTVNFRAYVELDNALLAGPMILAIETANPCMTAFDRDEAPTFGYDEGGQCFLDGSIITFDKFKKELAPIAFVRRDLIKYDPKTSKTDEEVDVMLGRFDGPTERAIAAPPVLENPGDPAGLAGATLDGATPFVRPLSSGGVPSDNPEPTPEPKPQDEFAILGIPREELPSLCAHFVLSAYRCSLVGDTPGHQKWFNLARDRGQTWAARHDKTALEHECQDALVKRMVNPAPECPDVNWDWR